LQFVAVSHDERRAGGQERSEAGSRRPIALELEHQPCEFRSISHRYQPSLSGRDDLKLCRIAHIAAGSVRYTDYDGPVPPPVRVLSLHAPYRCRHAGACCTSNWPIPIEADRLSSIRAALATGRLQPAVGDRESAVRVAPDAPAETPAILGRADHDCVFYDRSPAAAAGRCRIQSVLGHEGLPLACRQFPRVSVHDPRGVSVTLSHYCPTAAGLLTADQGRTIRSPSSSIRLVFRPLASTSDWTRGRRCRRCFAGTC
jgi:Fe-S-cluster containining protein